MKYLMQQNDDSFRELDLPSALQDCMSAWENGKESSNWDCLADELASEIS